MQLAEQSQSLQEADRGKQIICAYKSDSAASFAWRQKHKVWACLIT
jgi:hypothetical protein